MMLSSVQRHRVVKYSLRIWATILAVIVILQFFVTPISSRHERYLVRQDGHCGARPVVGNCLGAITKWYWNNKAKKCENHIWSGCGPGGLGFPSKLSCQCGCAYCHTMNYK